MKLFWNVCAAMLVSAFFALPLFAADQAMGDANANAKMDPAKITSEVHRMMSDSYLKASEVFANGLDQLLSRDFPITNKDLQTHIDYYIKGAVENLKAARVHLTEFSGTYKRSPASQSDESQKTGASLTKATQSVQQAIDTANGIKTSLSKPLAGAQWKSQVQQQVSQLKDQIRAAMSSEKDLKQG